MEARSIEVKNISFAVGNKTILDHASFGVEVGEVVGVIGPNGAGKSTALRCLVRIIEPTGGEIRVLDKPVSEYKIRDFAKITAFVPQSTVFTFPLTVREAVLLGRIPHLGTFSMEGSEDYAVAQKCLEVVGMEEFADRVVTSLSGGEKQLVAIGRALAQEPMFLILDEPTSNLDINHQLTIMNLLKELAANGKGIALALHDLRLASRFCTKILALNGGKVIAYGTPEEVMTEEILQEVFSVSIYIGKHAETGHTIIEPIEPL